MTQGNFSTKYTYFIIKMAINNDRQLQLSDDFNYLCEGHINISRGKYPSDRGPV